MQVESMTVGIDQYTRFIYSQMNYAAPRNNIFLILAQLLKDLGESKIKDN